MLNLTTDSTDLLNLKFFMGELKTFIDGFPFHGFYFPVSYLEGVQVIVEQVHVQSYIELISG